MGDNVYQFDLFNFAREQYKITKPIRLIELFSGIGAQAKALEILGVPFEHWKTCEWAVNSIKSYNAIHIKDFTDYSKDLTKEELVAYLDGNISTNYNEPCNVLRQNEKWLRDTYNNCVATHNLMNIMKVKGSDLEIVDTDNYEYIMTYSFPCQDLSLAGQRKGMGTSQADGGTRSGLLWEVERILDELEHKPQILLMENVPEVIGTGNVGHFNKWLAKLESLGYTNHFQILNAKNYCIPQNRRRCFMISILGDYAYDFPLKHKAKYCLKDFLEKQVPEKYFLSDKMIEFFTYNTEKQKENGNGFEFKPIDADDPSAIGKTITTRNGTRMDDNFIQHIADLNYYNHEQSNRVYSADGCSPTLSTKGEDDARGIKIVEETQYTEKSLERIEKNIVEDENAPCITANAMQSINHQNCVLIKENNNQGFKEATDGDGVNIASRMHHQRGNVQKGSIQTLKAQMEIAVVVEEKNLKQELCDKLIQEGKVEEMQVIRHSYTNNRLKGDKPINTVQSVDTNVSPTLDTRCDCLGVVVKEPTDKVINPLKDKTDKSWFFEQNVYDSNGCTRALKATEGSGNIPKVIEESVFTDMEKEMFTEDGNVKRYLNSDKVDKFEDGQMATLNYPNGYGHGPRTHNESVALTTGQQPVVKNNLRIRKLVPCETMKLMGFERKDYQAMRDIGMSDSAIYHCSGDSIVVTCLIGLMGTMLFDEKTLKQKIEDYATSIVEN